MDHRHYHSPVKPSSTRGRCPVCHEAVYSRAGIHPQCAVKLYDPPRPKAKPMAPVLGDQAVRAPERTEAGAAFIPTHSVNRSAPD
jgi:hypothetical protein